MSDDLDLDFMNAAFRDFVPHNRALGLTVVNTSPPRVTAKLPWSPRLVGNPTTLAMHGGAITTLLDACSGISVYLKLRETTAIATLDLRVDFLSAVPAQRDVFATAECHHLTRTIAFVRAWAWADDPEAPFAVATATFARAGSSLKEPT
jgi:uncharacterized protein (TIGR00369 family)